MNGVRTILTKVRPIRKVFVIEKNDRDALINCVRISTEEVSGLRNLILVNDEDLFSENTIAFVGEHDPDVVVNFSEQNDRRLAQSFKTKVCPKNSTLVRRYSTRLYTFRNIPIGLRDYVVKTPDAPTPVRSVILPAEDRPTDQQLWLAINCGLASQEMAEHLKLSVFDDVVLTPLREPNQLFDVFKEKRETLLHIAEPFCRSVQGSSIWSINNNAKRLFDNKRTVVIGGYSDLKSMTYFWNERATFPDCRFIWLPAEEITTSAQHFAEFDQCCDFRTSRKEESETLPWSKVDSSRFYFPEMDAWQTFEYVQNVGVAGNEIRISHPSERLFAADFMTCVLEVRGLEEALLPTSEALGDLFVPGRTREFSPEFFSRISKKGLSVYVSSFEVLGDQPLLFTLTLPNERTILDALLAQYGLKLSESNGTRIIGQILTLVGGFSGIELFANKYLFEMMVALSPRRTERIVKELGKDLVGLQKEKIEEILAKRISEIATTTPRTIVDSERLLAFLPREAKESQNFSEQMQSLIDHKILLRGKSFGCPYCSSTLWFPLETINEENKCYCCNQKINIPAFCGARALSDAFRLNELVCTAVDQGVLPVLVTISLLNKQRFRGKRFLYDLIVSDAHGNQVAEVDLLVTFGKRLGLAEVKADRGFNLDQVDRLILTASKAEANFLLFSTLKLASSEEVKTLTAHLQAKQLRIPAFILTNEALFAPEPPFIDSFFEVTGANRFPTGPIVVLPKNKK